MIRNESNQKSARTLRSIDYSSLAFGFDYGNTHIDLLFPLEKADSRRVVAIRLPICRACPSWREDLGRIELEG